jgi:prepilin peptidase CpaA
LITAALQDIFAGKVTNRLIATGLVTGLVFQVMEHGAWGIWFFLGNISVPIVLLYLLFQMRALGAGDIKLFSMTGGILTIGELCRCMVYTFLAAGLAAFFVLTFDRDRRRKLFGAMCYLAGIFRTKTIIPYRVTKESGKGHFAFAVFILFGVYAALYCPVVW